MDADAMDIVIASIKTVMNSIRSNKPHQYVLNYDREENKGGITLTQLLNALWKVVKGNDKTYIISVGSSPEILSKYGKGIWKFDRKSGVILPV